MLIFFAQPLFVINLVHDKLKKVRSEATSGEMITITIKIIRSKKVLEKPSIYCDKLSVGD